MIEYIGVAHVHSLFSDGTGEIPEIANFADESGLDFLLMTDHNTLRGLKEGYEKWYGKTLCLIGCEINDKENKNHYLAFGINETYSTRLAAKDYVRKVKEAGGIGFLAHPHEKRNHMEEHPPYPWVDWSIEDYDGIEIWNHMSEWMENLTEQNKYTSFLHPLRSIVAPPPETLKLWDELNLKRKVVGIGGPLLKGNTKQKLAKSKAAIYEALAYGRSFIANDYHTNSKGFQFFAKSGKKKYYMGDYIDFSDKITLYVTLPAQNAEIKIIRNGKEIADFSSDKAEFEVTKAGVYSKAEFEVTKAGVYRVEVRYFNKAWIYSNHIRIGI
ncbi:MAG: putative family metal-dependent phosphoesterase [Ignavibacteriaceae bacterium]|nr:putative family metal-dependent phosphoesterase [Ignavibacteriaceae bacterium]